MKASVSIYNKIAKTENTQLTLEEEISPSALRTDPGFQFEFSLAVSK